MLFSIKGTICMWRKDCFLERAREYVKWAWNTSWYNKVRWYLKQNTTKNPMEMGSKDPGATRTVSQETESEITNEKMNEGGLGEWHRQRSAWHMSSGSHVISQAPLQKPSAVGLLCNENSGGQRQMILIIGHHTQLNWWTPGLVRDLVCKK